MLICVSYLSLHTRDSSTIVLCNSPLHMDVLNVRRISPSAHSDASEMAFTGSLKGPAQKSAGFDEFRETLPVFGNADSMIFRD
jgi:hypothetical protein